MLVRRIRWTSNVDLYMGRRTSRRFGLITTAHNAMVFARSGIPENFSGATNPANSALGRAAWRRKVLHNIREHAEAVNTPEDQEEQFWEAILSSLPTWPLRERLRSLAKNFLDEPRRTPASRLRLLSLLLEQAGYEGKVPAMHLLSKDGCAEVLRAMTDTDDTDGRELLVKYCSRAAAANSAAGEHGVAADLLKGALDVNQDPNIEGQLLCARAQALLSRGSPTSAAKCARLAHAVWERDGTPPRPEASITLALALQRKQEHDAASQVAGSVGAAAVQDRQSQWSLSELQAAITRRECTRKRPRQQLNDVWVDLASLALSTPLSQVRCTQVDHEGATVRLLERLCADHEHCRITLFAEPHCTVSSGSERVSVVVEPRSASDALCARLAEVEGPGPLVVSGSAVQKRVAERGIRSVSCNRFATQHLSRYLRQDRDAAAGRRALARVASAPPASSAVHLTNRPTPGYIVSETKDSEDKFKRMYLRALRVFPDLMHPAGEPALELKFGEEVPEESERPDGSAEQESDDGQGDVAQDDWVVAQ
eukprot:TRINITY_DN36300_c0_g1_i1.p1 TRINITY_DN36300_c0_g1~~TRINITY_DN36300_c0_g1_i1.p1  ORF type:complete len:539 (+),score=83.37 TRINITY_DN36300_c0_g1_i1:67-1683(+)